MDTSFLSIPLKGPPDVAGHRVGLPLFGFGRNSGFNEAFDIFELYGITTLQELKHKSRKKFRQLIFQIHPDTGTRKTVSRNQSRAGMNIYKLKHYYDKIQKMKYVPMTIGNCEKLLELQKGYKTTADVDLGLNG